MKVIVVGGVAAGPKAASRIGRLCPDAEITLFEKGRFLSYAACGLPYLLKGDVSSYGMLMSTVNGTLRNPEYFETVKNVAVRTKTEVFSIDRANKSIVYKRVDTGEMGNAAYDKLVLATGARPVRPPLPGADLGNVLCLHTIDDAKSIKSVIAKTTAAKVVIVGGGLIGVETAEALVALGCHVTIVEMLPQILQPLDWEMAMQIQRHLEEHGVTVLTNTRVDRFLPADDGQTARGVVAAGRELLADLCLLSVGVRPNVELAKVAGLEIGELGGIVTDEGMRTSDPDIYAAGDCVETRHLITGKPCYAPLGSTANKQGRVAANSICGVRDAFRGVLGSMICKAFEVTAARTGLSEGEARAAGFDVVTCLCPAPDRPHFMPSFKMLTLKLIAERKTGRLLGAQAVGPGNADKRINVAATAIAARMTVDDLANLDLAYAPPYSAAMDNLLTAANIVRNKIGGQMDGMTPTELKARMDAGDDFVLLDPRHHREVAEVKLPGTTNISLKELRKRVGEIPVDKEVVCLCMLSLRGYEAACIVRNSGHKNVKVLDGGIIAWPYEKITR